MNRAISLRRAPRRPTRIIKEKTMLRISDLVLEGYHIDSSVKGPSVYFTSNEAEDDWVDVSFADNDESMLIVQVVITCETAAKYVINANGKTAEEVSAEIMELEGKR